MCHVSYRNVCQAGAAMILVHYGLKGNKKNSLPGKQLGLEAFHFPRGQ